MKILITGGAGYIGSAIGQKLADDGHQVTVIDNLSKGRKSYVDKRNRFKKGDVRDAKFVDKVFKKGSFDAIVHCAALKDVGESMRDPWLYSSNNIAGALTILEAAKKYDVKKIVFSSSAAVYGDCPSGIAMESAFCKPTNYYGFTKLVVEDILKWYHELSDTQYVLLRYFNVAGDAGLGYIDPKANNIFNIIAEVATGKRQFFEIYGNDYDTPDGTGIRDYIHLIDLVDAHVKALEYKDSDVFNLGTGHGYSVMEILDSFKKVTGKEIPIKLIARRPGDIAKLITSPEKTLKLLSWQPQHTLEEMVQSTWQSYSN